MRAMSDRERAFQEALLPLNVILCIVCLAAFLSLLLMPLITFSVSNVVAITKTNGQYADPIEEKLNVDQMYSMIGNTKAEVNLTTIDLFKIVVSDKASDELIRILLADSGAIETIGFSVVRVSALYALGYTDGDPGNSIPSINNAIRKLKEVTTFEETGKFVDAFVAAYEAEFGQTERREELEKWIGRIYETASVGVMKPRNVDFEAMLCVSICNVYALNKAVVDYTAMADILLGNGAKGTVSAMLSEKSDYFRVIFTCVFLLVASACLCWFVMAVLTSIHALMDDRRMSMWYVKFFCLLPPLVFLVIPILLPTYGVSFTGILAIISRIGQGAFSYTMVSGSCYLLVWFLYFFWELPVSSQIKKEQFR